MAPMPGPECQRALRAGPMSSTDPCVALTVALLADKVTSRQMKLLGDSTLTL